MKGEASMGYEAIDVVGLVCNVVWTFFLDLFKSFFEDLFGVTLD